MSKELVIKKCNSCGAMVKVIEDCTCDNCGIKCCGEEMMVVVPNSFDAAVEKHIPTYEVVNNEIEVKLNHPMEEDHYIEWIELVSEDANYCVKLKPGQEAKARFPYIPGSTIYSYCNKHSLWKKDVE